MEQYTEPEQNNPEFESWGIFYSPWQVAICGYFLGPLALSYYIQQNYLVLGQVGAAREVRLLGFFVTAVLLFLMFQDISRMLYHVLWAIPPIIGGWRYVYRGQLKPLGMKNVHRYHETWHTIKEGIWGFLWLFLMGIIAGVVFVFFGWEPHDVHRGHLFM